MFSFQFISLFQTRIIHVASIAWVPSNIQVFNQRQTVFPRNSVGHWANMLNGGANVVCVCVFKKNCEIRCTDSDLKVQVGLPIRCIMPNISILTHIHIHYIRYWCGRTLCVAIAWRYSISATRGIETQSSGYSTEMLVKQTNMRFVQWSHNLPMPRHDKRARTCSRLFVQLL